MAKKKQDDGSEPGFEQALERLEEIVERMEAGDLPLEEAMALFEEGVTLGQACAQRLDEAERKITVLLERADGALEETPYDASAASEPEAARRASSAPPRRAAAPKPAARQATLDDADGDIPF